MDHRSDMAETIQVSVPFHNTGNIFNHSVKQHQFVPLHALHLLGHYVSMYCAAIIYYGDVLLRVHIYFICIKPRNYSGFSQNYL